MLGLGLPAALIWNAEPFTAAHLFPDAGSSFAAALWIAALLASLIMAWRADRLLGLPVPGAQTSDRIAAEPWRRAMPISLLAATLVAALVLRLWRLDILPFGVWIDEVDSLANAQALSHLPFQPYAPGNYGHTPSLYAYTQAAVVHFLGTGIVSLRLVSALFGVLGVAAAFAVGKAYAEYAYGLIAAVLLAVSAWSITISRLGMSNIAAPALLGLGAWALCSALVSPAASWFLLSGIFLGLAMMTYVGSVATIAAAIVFAAFRLYSDRTYRRAAWPAAALLPAGFVLAALPLLVAAHLDPAFYSARMSSVALSHEYADWAHFIPALLRNTGRHLLMFTASGDQNGRQNLPGAPMLDPVTGTCFVLGVGVAVRYSSRWVYQLLLLWLAAALSGGILTLDGEAPQSLRSLAALIPTVLIAALPLLLLWQAGMSQEAATAARGKVPGWRRVLRPRAISAAALCAVLALAGWLNVDRYFNQQAANLAAWEANGGARVLAGRQVTTLRRQGYTVLVDPALVAGISGLDYPTLRYDAGGDVTLLDLARPMPTHNNQRKLALIILPEHRTLWRDLLSHYPEATSTTLTPSFDSRAVEAWVLRIPVRPAT